MAENCNSTEFIAGDTIYIIEREDGIPEDICGVLFMAKCKDYAICTPRINNLNFDEILAYLAEETGKNYDCDLCVYNLQDCFSTKDEALEKLKQLNPYADAFVPPEEEYGVKVTSQYS